MKKEVVYIAELDADVDDVIAAEYLNMKGVLKAVVLDPIPRTVEGKQRQESLNKMGIKTLEKIESSTDYVFCGGALTKVAEYIKNGNKLKALVMNGGFVGCNILSDHVILNKFKGKKCIRTFNFNMDVNSADYVLRTTEDQIKEIILVGKNVCHSIINTADNLWKSEEYVKLFDKYKVKPGKRQHDMLACHEGLCILNLAEMNKSDAYCKFLGLRPMNQGLKGKYTEWGSELPISMKGNLYRIVTAAVGYVKQ